MDEAMKPTPIRHRQRCKICWALGVKVMAKVLLFSTMPTFPVVLKSMYPLFTLFCRQLDSSARAERWWAAFQASRAGMPSWLVQVSLAAQLIARHQEGRCVCQLAQQHDHLQTDPASSTQHTDAGRPCKILCLGSLAGKISRLSCKLLLVQIGEAQPWPHEFSPTRNWTQRACSCSWQARMQD